MGQGQGSLELGFNQTIAPKENYPRSGLGFALGLVLVFGGRGGQFSLEAIVLEPKSAPQPQIYQREVSPDFIFLLKSFSILNFVNGFLK